MTDSTATNRPPLSPRECAAFERLLTGDPAAARALCFPDPAKPEPRARAQAALATARAADAAANEGRGNFYSERYAAWMARETLACGAQVAA